jgi:hypothetical protein
VGEVLLRPELQRPGEDFLAVAEGCTTGDLRDIVRKRKEEAELPEPPVPLRFEVSMKGAEDFKRCRDLVSRKVGTLVTEGHAFEVVCEDYLEHNDPVREAQRLEEKDETAKASLKGNGCFDGRGRVNGRRRALPSLTRREVLRRFGDRCWVKGCRERVFLQKAHLHPVRAGGTSFPWDLAQLCLTHHRQYDGGAWFLREKADGTLVMIDSRGLKVGEFVSGENILDMAPDGPPP